jgi:putative colanic acid biosynthesis glycosyltransferase
MTSALTPKPFFTIVTITKDDPGGFEITSQSIKSQQYNNFLWFVKDASVYKKGYSSTMSSWCDRACITLGPDNGIYDAFNQLLDKHDLEWTIFINGGDALASRDTLTRLASYICSCNLNPTAKIIIGGTTLLLTPRGSTILHKSRNPSSCCSIFSYRIPCCHQSMVFSPGIVQYLRYDLSYTICGDGDYFWRAIKIGATYHRLSMPVSIFSLGGLSMFYKGFLKQVEVYKFVTQSKGEPILVACGATLLSLVTSLLQRIIYYFVHL